MNAQRAAPGRDVAPGELLQFFESPPSRRPACDELVNLGREAAVFDGATHVRLIWPWQDRNRRFSWLKAIAFALVLLPAIRFAYQFATGEYGILPIALGGMTFWSGVWATWVLLAALAVTPTITVFRWRALIAVRRMIGVAALAYTVAHVVFYFGLRSWNWGGIAVETFTRLTLIVATISTVGLIVLGATSLDDMIRRMGADKWQRLHNTTYVITGLALLHVVLARGTYTEQYALAGVFIWLMVWRGLDRYGKGADVKALAMLTVGSSIAAALLEAGFLWGRRGYVPSSTLGTNFSLATIDAFIPPSWQVLAFGLVFVLGAAGREMLRVRAASIEARQAG
jgi:methionine sulfoxide reductase heme-binding subunit